MLSRFQTILAGLPSIHAFDVLPPFLAETPRLLVVCGHVTQLGQHMATFLTWRSDLLAAAISAATAAVANLLRARLTSGRLGVALTASAGINGLLKYLIQQMVATEANMHSVARMNAYFVSLPRETDQQGLSPPSDWPSQGTVVFDDVQMRYGDGPLVLKGVSFAAQAKETLGVVGRTGAGKSVAGDGHSSVCGHSVADAFSSMKWTSPRCRCGDFAPRWESSRRSPRCFPAPFGSTSTRAAATPTRRSGRPSKA